MGSPFRSTALWPQVKTVFELGPHPRGFAGVDGDSFSVLGGKSRSVGKTESIVDYAPYTNSLPSHSIHHIELAISHTQLKVRSTLEIHFYCFSPFPLATSDNLLCNLSLQRLLPPTTSPSTN